MSDSVPTSAPTGRIVHVHEDPASCRRGFNDDPCPACRSFQQYTHDALLALTDLSDAMKDEALHWIADEQPDVVLHAIREIRR